MRNFIIIGTAVLLTACGSSETTKPVKQVDNRSCSQKMYDIGETIRSMHSLGYSRSIAMDKLVDIYGPKITQLSDFTSVVWSMPKGHWADGEVGGQLRDAAIAQGCR
jgi:cytochrome c-type biogenesis protein CcmH/NrfF